jgi:hypothetical protein
MFEELIFPALKKLIKMIVTNFPDLSSITNEGLRELTNPIEQRDSNQRIRKFLTKLPNQPPFFISRKSWDYLSKGMQYYNDSTGNMVEKTWISKDYEVYAFVFCIAFSQNDHNKRAYFRVRTIKKEKTKTAIGPLMTVEVETDNVAYVDLGIAISNRGKPKRDWQDCLKFIDPSDVISRNSIDNEVVLASFSVPHTLSLIPRGFINGDKSIINNEGDIFSKNRIMSLLNRYKDLGSKISFTLQPDNVIGFDFKINVQADTEIKCPPVGVC